MMWDSIEPRLPPTVPTTRREGAKKSGRRQHIIVALKHDTEYAEREVDWQETVKPSFQAIVDLKLIVGREVGVRCAV